MKIILLIFLSFISTALFADPVILNDNLSSQKIGLHLEYLEDKNKTLTIENITSNEERYESLWKKSMDEVPGFGYKDSAYWIRFTVENTEDRTIEWYLNEENPLIGYINLYIQDDNKKFRVIKTGYRLNFSERPIRYRSFVFPLITGSGRTVTYYLRYESEGNVSINLNVYTPYAFQKMKNAEIPMLWIFYGILGIMVFYNLFILFVSRDISYFYYILYIAIFCLIFMTIDGSANQYLWPESSWWASYCIPFFISMVTSTSVQLTRTFLRTYDLDNKYDLYFDKFLILFAVLCLIVGFCSFFILDYRFFAKIAIVMAIIAIVLLISFAVYIAIFKNNRQARFFLSSFLLFCIGALFYLLKNWGILAETFITNNSIKIGALAQVILLAFGLADRINSMERMIEEAEQKYRHLVETSNDITFSLDNNLTIININSVVYKYLGYNVEELINNNILDYIYERRTGTQGLERSLVEEYIKDLIKKKEPVTFKTYFKSRYSHDYKELSVSLEYVDIESGEFTILGKAYPVVDDIVVNYLDAEETVYNINNFFVHADFVSQRLTRNLVRFLEPSKLSQIRVALREILINAIEHGNLNIQFNEKSEALNRGHYLDFLKNRQNDPKYRNKKVKIEYSLNEKNVFYRVTDEGEGFDYNKMIEKVKNASENELLLHGRGLLITLKIFDIINFNSKGNQVEILKYFKK